MKNVYEVHLTVSNATNLEEFKQVCKEYNLKPIYLDLVNKQEVHKDLMTSQIVKANSLRYVYMDVVALHLVFPFEITRIKIETPLENTNDPCKYYECHISMPRKVEKDCGFHLSKNTLKQGTWMYTLREKDYELFDARVREFIVYNDDALKVIKERCVYDSNEQHDDKWFK